MAANLAKQDRRAKFNDTVKNAIINLTKQNKTQQEIAEILGISPKTFSLWKGKHAELGAAIEEAREVQVELLETATFQNAIGWQHEEEVAFFDKDTGKIVKDTIVKKFQPSDRAAIFLLKNWAGDTYKEGVNTEQNLNLLQVILTEAINCNPDNNRIIADVVGNQNRLEAGARDSNDGELQTR